MESPQTTEPTLEEFIQSEFWQVMTRDIYDTFVQGGRSHKDWWYFTIPSEKKEVHYRQKALTHLAHAHNFQEGPESYDLVESENNIPTGKRHLANALARLAVSRFHQLMRDNGKSMKMLEEAKEE